MADNYMKDKAKEITAAIAPIINSIYEDGYHDAHNEASKLKIEVSRIHRLDATGATKAFVDISVADALIIKGVQIVEGASGLFVSMPKESGKDGKWYNTVIPLTREVKEEIDRVIMAAYKGTTE